MNKQITLIVLRNNNKAGNNNTIILVVTWSNLYFTDKNVRPKK